VEATEYLPPLVAGRATSLGDAPGRVRLSVALTQSRELGFIYDIENEDVPEPGWLGNALSSTSRVERAIYRPASGRRIPIEERDRHATHTTCGIAGGALLGGTGTGPQIKRTLDMVGTKAFAP
jgi:hypothetical protein